MKKLNGLSLSAPRSADGKYPRRPCANAATSLPIETPSPQAYENHVACVLVMTSRCSPYNPIYEVQRAVFGQTVR